MVRQLHRIMQNILISFYNKNLKIGDFAVNNKIYINYSRMLVIFLSLFGIFIIIKYRKI